MTDISLDVFPGRVTSWWSTFTMVILAIQNSLRWITRTLLLEPSRGRDADGCENVAGVADVLDAAQILVEYLVVSFSNLKLVFFSLLIHVALIHVVHHHIATISVSIWLSAASLEFCHSTWRRWDVVFLLFIKVPTVIFFLGRLLIFLLVALLLVSLLSYCFNCGEEGRWGDSRRHVARLHGPWRHLLPSWAWRHH